METFSHKPDFSKYAEGETFYEFATAGGYVPGKIVTDPVTKDKSLVFTGVWISYPKVGSDIIEGGSLRGGFSIRPVDTKFQLTFEAQESFTRDYAFAALEHKLGRFVFSLHRQWFDWASGKAPFGSLDCGPFDTNSHNVSVVFRKENATLQFDMAQKMMGIPAMDNIRVDSARLRSWNVVGGIVAPSLYIHKLEVAANS